MWFDSLFTAAEVNLKWVALEDEYDTESEDDDESKEADEEGFREVYELY